MSSNLITRTVQKPGYTSNTFDWNLKSWIYVSVAVVDFLDFCNMIFYYMNYYLYFSYYSFSDILDSMDANFNCSWTWNCESKVELEMQFALFRGLCFQFYGERWRSTTMKTEWERRKTLQSAFFHVVCGCGGLEKTRQRMGVKVWGGEGGEPARVLRDLRVCGGSSFERLSTDLLFPLHSPHQCHLQTYLPPPPESCSKVFSTNWSFFEVSVKWKTKTL